MFRALQLPYGRLKELWLDMRYQGVYERAERVALFGNEAVPDFLKGEVPHANKFGSDDPRKEIGDPDRALDALAVPQWAIELIDVSRDVGRFYDEQERVYLRGYNDTQWFVRLPRRSRDPRSEAGVSASFPVIGEEVVLHRRDETRTLVVYRVDRVSGARRITASLQAYLSDA